IRQQCLHNRAGVVECDDFAIEHFQHEPNRAIHFLIIVNNPDLLHSRCALIEFATSPGTTAFKSSIEASLILSTEPKCFKRAFRRVGPTPGMASSCEAMPSFWRFLRCAVIP